MTRPDFIIIGAMKCGTSTLAAQLGAQDGVFMTDPKEPNYFSDDAVFARGPGWYAGLFADAAPGALRGEASTHYTKRPDLPRTLERMQAVLPAPRLVYMIRDPMVRIVSHYIHEWSQGVLSGSIGQALDDCPALVDYGRYGYQVAPFVQAYGAGAILLTSLEELTADPAGELARVAAFLGLEAAPVWQAEVGRENVSAERTRRLPLQGLVVDNPLATVLRRTLVPKAVRNWIRSSRQMKTRPAIPPDRRAALEARFAEDREALARFFPGARTLDAAYPFLAS